MPRVLALALFVALTPSSSYAPSQPITALAPFEIWADGFGELRGIAVDGDGTVFVTDRHAGTVTRIAPDQSGTIIASGLERPIGLALDPTGRLLVAEEQAGRVVRIGPEGARTPLVSGIKQPRWLAVGDDGTVFIAARRLTHDADHEAEDESDEPEMILALTPDGHLRVFADGLRQLQGLALGEQVLYAATRGLHAGPSVDGVVLQIPIRADGSAGPPTTLGPTGGFKHPVGLARDQLGALYLTTKELDLLKAASKRAIAKLHPDGTLTLFAARLEHPQGLAFNAEGDLFVADIHRVLRFRAPPAPAFTGLPAATNQSPFTVTGTAEPGARVDLFVNDAPTPLTMTAAEGRFTLAVPLKANATNDLDAFATGHAGQGLTGPAATATLLHDGIAPDVVFLAPSNHVRRTVDVQARASDGGSGVATLILTAGGQPLPAALTPEPPAPSIIATAPWKTSTLTDGVYTLEASATDGAGNATAISGTVTVDNTPPDAQISSGPAGTTQDTTVTFAFTGTDNLTPVNALVFAWRLDSGPWSESASATSATLPSLAPGPHTFAVKARDLAGNEDPTPAQQSFTVSSLQITITSPPNGTTVPAGSLIVRGTVDAGGAEVGVAVNAVPAAVQGTAFAAVVPVAPDTTSVTAVATTATGLTANHSAAITVSATLPPAITLLVSPQSGVAPMTVGFSLNGSPTPATIEFDFDGNGTVDTGPGLEGQTFTYALPGLYFPRVTVTDTQGNGLTASTVVQVFDPNALDALLQGKWTTLKDALRRGDIDGSLETLALGIRSRYRPALQVLSGDLPAFASTLGDLQITAFQDGLAEAVTIRLENGQRHVYFIYFVPDDDGLWRILGM